MSVHRACRGDGMGTTQSSLLSNYWREYPSQSPNPDQPASAHTVFGFVGMSAGFLLDLRYFVHSAYDFKPGLRAMLRASSKSDLGKEQLCLFQANRENQPNLYPHMIGQD